MAHGLSRCERRMREDVNDVRFVRAEGVAMGDDAKAAALDSAEQSIRTQVVAANQSTMAQAS